MKLIILVISLTLSSFALAGFGDKATTNAEYVGIIDIQTLSGVAVYYFKPKNDSENWGSTQCPNAQFAFIKQSTPGADAILSVALTAKSTKTKVQFRGICGNGIFNGTSDQYLYADFLTITNEN